MPDFRNHWPRWLGAYAAVILATTVALAADVARYGVLQAFLVANLLVLLVLPLPVAFVCGRRKYRTPRARRCFHAFMLLVACAMVSGYAKSVMEARSITGLVPKTTDGILFAVLALSTATVAMFVSMTEEARREARQQAAQAQAELKLLQAQVEPHFLFNTLANLRHLVQTGSAQSLPMLDHLVQYLRTTLPDIRTPASTVGRETELARAYLEIMRMRMGGALEFAIEVPPELAEAQLPPLLLMTLVENAVKHGIAPRGGGRIAIRALSEGKRLRIEVDDDGPGLTRPMGRGVGLANVRERLQALYGERARLELVQRAPAGLAAAILIER